jgi:hypothetical protein
VGFITFPLSVQYGSDHTIMVTSMQESGFGLTSLLTTSGAIGSLQVIGCANASAIGTKKGECFELPFFPCIWLQMLVNCCVRAY